MMQLSLRFYTFIDYCNRLERKSTDTGIIHHDFNINDEMINLQQVKKTTKKTTKTLNKKKKDKTTVGLQ